MGSRAFRHYLVAPACLSPAMSRKHLVLPLLLLGVQLAAQVPTTEPPRVDFAEANRRASLPRWLSLRWAEFDTAGPAPVLPADLTAVGDVDVHLVQVRGPVTEAGKQTLRAAGLELLDYVPNHAWIVRGDAAVVARLQQQGHVLWSSPLHPAYRLAPELLGREGTMRLSVLGFTGVPGATLEAEAKAAGATVEELHEQVDRWLAVVTATPDVIRRLVHGRDVQWVEPAAVLTERNDTTAWAIQTKSSGNTRIWNLGLHGEGQVIGHQDSSIPTGSCYFSDPVNPIGPSHRKIVYRSGTGTGSSHGTHTAGTAVGDAQPVNGSTSNRGMAYLAKIATSSDYSAAVWSTRASTHRTNGARIHTNSWGDDTTTAYNSHCNAIDAFAWTNEDNLVLFSETNLSTLKNPENAKNLIAVGNALNGTSIVNKGGGGVGPTADGRRKPDLFAPGTSIVSAGTGSCNTANLSGTSMACPAAAGAAALVRQYFVDGFHPSGAANPADSITPSAALLKSVLINTCQDMTGVAGYPSDTEGWGHILLDESLHFTGDLGRLWITDVRRAQGVTTGVTRDYFIDVLAVSRPLEVTMAFTDFAGTVNAANPVTNDLDLVVIAPNGTQYRGNDFASGWSTTGGVADTKNNVERVAIAAPAVGTWTIRVVGSNVPQGPCGFGLCATANIDGVGSAEVELYGAGKPGLLGEPVIAGTSPVIGTNWTLTVSNAYGNSLGVGVVGETPDSIPFDGGTVLATPQILFQFNTGFLGFFAVPVAIPNTPSLAGAELFWQVWIGGDPGASGEGWAATRGLRMHVGY